MIEVEEAMVSSVRHIIQRSLRVSVESTRHDWVENIPGQAVLCAAQVLWTAGITRAISQGMTSLKQYYQDILVPTISLYRYNHFYLLQLLLTEIKSKVLTQRYQDTATNCRYI